MCRLFGFRSVIEAQVHSSLVSADNALMHQSQFHPDGWGVAYYVAGAPHLIKSDSKAMDDHLFKKVSGIVSSHTVLAHLRKSTIGDNSIINTHPFQFGPWVFAHNGHIENFNHIKPQLVAKISPQLGRFILGDTDSEVLFYLILHQLSLTNSLNDPQCSLPRLVQAVKAALQIVTSLAGPFLTEETDAADKTYLSFIMTNGSTMLAHQGGKKLYYSTYKKKCPDRDTCKSFAPECEAKTTTGLVNHLIFSSEPLQGENIWIDLQPGQMVGIDSSMFLSLL